MDTYNYQRSVAINVSAADQNVVGPSRGIYVGGGGNLVCRMRNDQSDTTFTGLLVGWFYPFEVAVIRKTGTTITNSVVLY